MNNWKWCINRAQFLTQLENYCNNTKSSKTFAAPPNSYQISLCRLSNETADNLFVLSGGDDDERGDLISTHRSVIPIFLVVSQGVCLSGEMPWQRTSHHHQISWRN